jgi:hypothetical protein
MLIKVFTLSHSSTFFPFNSCLRISLIYISIIPSRFSPLPFPPSAQNLSLFVCSTNFAYSVPSNFAANNDPFANFIDRPYHITSYFTFYQSSLKAMLAFLPKRNASAGL